MDEADLPPDSFELDNSLNDHSQSFGNGSAVDETVPSSPSTQEAEVLHKALPDAAPTDECTESDIYEIEKILKTRKGHGKTEYLVKWLNHPSKQNSWVSEFNMVNQDKVQHPPIASLEYISCKPISNDNQTDTPLDNPVTDTKISHYSISTFITSYLVHMLLICKTNILSLNFLFIASALVYLLLIVQPCSCETEINFRTFI